LGGGIPVLHSLIHRDGNEVWIEGIASSPALEVNGERRKTARLVDGDRICIGPFEFQIVIPAVAAVQPGSSVDTSDQNAITPCADSPSPQSLTAAELVEQIEREQARVEQFESRQRMGADALMQEIIQRAAVAAQTIPQSFARAGHVGTNADTGVDRSSTSAQAPVAPADSADSERDSLLADIEHLVDKLQEYERVLHERAKRLAERETSCAEATTTLSESQQRLDEHLERLAKELARLQEPAALSQIAKLRKAV
jgi:hypothetical protein